MAKSSLLILCGAALVTLVVGCSSEPMGVATATVTVIRGDGNPAGGCFVAFEGGTEPITEEGHVTNDEGQTSKALPAGEYTATATCDRIEQSQDFTIAGGDIAIEIRFD